MSQQQSLFRFDRDLQRFADQLGIRVTTVVKKIGFDLFGKIVKHTPADTGRARASWTIAPNEPNRSVAGHEGHERLQGPAPSAAAGDAAVKASSQALASLKPYEPVWISNNLPYIEALEKGHSQQAPAGMVAVSLAETEAELDKALAAAERESNSGGGA